MLPLAARKHTNERIVAENEVMNQCCSSVKDRDNHERVGGNFVDLLYGMREGAVACPR